MIKLSAVTSWENPKKEGVAARINPAPNPTKADEIFHPIKTIKTTEREEMIAERSREYV